MPNIIHHIFAENSEDFIAAHNPGPAALKVLNHIVSCRTPALGAAVYDCACGAREFVYHSCRDRHCPVCQGMSNARWADKQMASALPVKYFHIVFTIPDTLNPFVLGNQKEAYGALFKAAGSALLKALEDPRRLGATPGFTAVLHTWGQTMQFHPHLHVLITAGGLSTDGARFIDKSDAGYLLPVKVLSRLFRGIFLDELSKMAAVPHALMAVLYQTEFFCYLEKPLDRADNVVKYLARYANRVCISKNRILAYSREGKTVTFSYKDNRDGGKQKRMTLTAVEFIRRFLLHVLPKRFMKIRHFGILNNRGKLARIERCRRLLNHTAIYRPPLKVAHDMVCKLCCAALRFVGRFGPAELKSVLIC